MSEPIQIHYLIYDDRWGTNGDRATVLAVHESREEAYKDLSNWPAGSVVVAARKKVQDGS